MSAPINDGGPAFPNECVMHNSKTADGMTLRDYFAAKAMAAFISANLAHPILRGTYMRIEEAAYFTADAMIAERDKK